MEDSDLAALVFRSSAAVAAGGAAIDSPLAGLAAAGLLPFVDEAVRRWQARQARNVARALEVAVDSAAVPPEDLLRRLTGDPSRLALFGEALTAAATSAVDSKVRVLGRALASGALAEDEALVDEERLWTRILLDIEAPHLRIMDYLMRDDPREGRGRIIAQQPDLASVAGASYLMTGLLLTTLERHGLTKSRDGSSYPKSYQLANETFWERGGLASSLMERFRDAGGHGMGTA